MMTHYHIDVYICLEILLRHIWYKHCIIMEAAHHLFMLSFQPKVSPAVPDFATHLQKYIGSHYQEDPHSYQKEIKDLSSLRQAACKAPQDFNGCSVLKRYFSQLMLLQNRFPMTDDGPACVPFQWTDLYSGSTFTITDIKYEQACILHNIGALHSVLGSMDSRANVEGMKMSCTHFQCAAWAFQHLRDTYPQPKGSDLSHDILTFMMNIMLAQAQECILEKSMLDNRKSSITAKVAMQVVDYYRAAFVVLTATSPSRYTINDVVGSKLHKSWRKYVDLKMPYFTSISHLFMGNHAEEQQKMGERFAWYHSARVYLNEALKVANKMSRTDLTEATLFLTDMVFGKYTISKKENEFVYHEKVPPFDSLPEIKGASLVKGISFDPADPDVCGVDVFARLVPMEAHASSSVYSEEKAKILRSVKAQIEEKNEQLSTYMSSLHLDKTLLNEEEEDLPQELLEKCAVMSVKPCVLLAAFKLMAVLQESTAKVEADLAVCQTLLTAEEQKEKEHQEMFGKRAPSMITMELRKESSKLDEAHKKASDSNKMLATIVETHMPNFNLLISPVEEIMERLPSLHRIKTAENEEQFNEFQKLLGKVDLMKKQRSYLEDDLRNALLKDDITKRIVATDNSADLQKIFEDELKKHEQCLTYIERNLSAQDNILQALTDANASFSDIRTRLVNTKQERSNFIKGLLASYEAFQDLVAKVKKGIEFYEKLKSSVSRLLDRIKSVTKVQDEERTQRMGAQKPIAAASHNLPPAVKSTTAPKLKDYLPYMTNTNLPSAVTSNVQPVPVMNNQPAVPPSSYPSLPNATASIPTVDRSSKNNLRNMTPPQVIPGVNKIAPNTGSYCGPDPSMMQPQYPVSYAAPSQYPSQIGQQNSQVYSPPVNTFSTGYPQQNPSMAMYGASGASVSYATSGNATSNIPRSSSFVAPGMYAVPCPVSNEPTSGMPLNNARSYPTGSNVTPTHSVPGNSGATSDPGSMKMSNVYGQSFPSNASHDANQSIPVSNLPTGYVIPATNVAGHMVSNIPNYNRYTTCHPAENIPSYGVVGNPLANVSSTVYQNFSAPYNTAGTVQYTGYANNAGVTVSSQNTIMPISSTSIMNHPETTTTPYPATAPATAVERYNTGQYAPQNYATSSYPPYASQASANPAYSAPTPYMTQYQDMSLSQPGGYTVYQNQDIPSVSLSQVNIPQVPANQSPSVVQQDYACFQQDYNSAQDINVLTPIPAHITPSVAPSSLTSEAAKDEKETAEVKGSESSAFSAMPSVTEHAVPSKQDVKNNLEILQIKELEKQRVLKSKEKVSKDPFEDPTVLARFGAEVEKFEKLVEGLVIKSLNGTVPLDQKWKELSIAEEKDSKKMSISVARCYPLKNRVPDIMPYDSNRVKLTTCKDDYINASYLKDLLSSSPPFIITQAPLPATFSDFWMMVWEQQVENVICLVSSNELKNHVYWPQERGKVLVSGPLELSLQSQKSSCSFTERIISVTHTKNKTSRVVIHLQFNVWQPSKLPEVDDLLPFVSEVLSYYRQQRTLQRPLVVHCSAGVGRSGAFCLITSLASEMDSGQGPKDLTQVAARMFQQRKFIINDKDHLQFCYQVVLGYAQKTLKKKGLVVCRPSFEEKPTACVLPISKSGDPVHPVLPVVELSVESTPSSPERSPTMVDDNKKETEETEAIAIIEEIKESFAAVEDQSRDTCITSVLDPTKFTMDSSGLSTGKRRITKDMFTTCTGNLSSLKPESSDPLSQLDPLWSLKKP